MTTKPGTPRLSSLAVLAMAVLGFLASCNNDYGVFASIQEEKPGATKGPFYRSSVGEVLLWEGSYWARRSSIARSTSGIGGWTTVDGGGLPAGYVCTGLAATSSPPTLHAAILGSGLWSTTDGISWTRLADTLIESIYAANGVLFVADHDEKGTATDSSDDTWILSYLNGASLVATGLAPAAGNPILGLAWDGAGGLGYWVLTRQGLYVAASEAGPFADPAESNQPATGLSSISANPTTSNLYVGTDSGKVHARFAATWAAPVTVLASARVTALAELPLGAGTILVAGLGGSTTGATGYAEIAVNATTLGSAATGDGSSSALSAGEVTNYDTTLKGKPVNGFYYIGTRLYAAVASAGIPGATGLYYDEYADPVWSGWTAE